MCSFNWNLEKMYQHEATQYPQFLFRHEVFLQTKHGVEAKSYEGLGDAAKLKPLEVELKRLEDLSESIVQDFAYMRQREVIQFCN